MVQQDMIGSIGAHIQEKTWVWKVTLGMEHPVPYIAVAHTMPQVSKRVSSLVCLVLTLKTNNRMSLPDSD